MIDFEKFAVNCSQLGAMMGNPRNNTPPTAAKIKKLLGILGRDYGELTESMKYNARQILTQAIMYDPKRPTGTILSEMACIYAYEMYGKGQVSKGNESPLQLEKGSIVEPEAISLLSLMDGVEYVKNEKVFRNKWFKGIPDILCLGENDKIEKIIEIKASYDLPSFIISQLKPESSKNFYEVLGYMDLTGCKSAEIVHILVDIPEKIAKYEEKRLIERYESLSLDGDEISRRILDRLNDMTFGNISNELKVFRRPVAYNKYTIKAMKSRANVAKRWMQSIHDNFTKNSLNSFIIEDENHHQEDSF